MIRILFSMSRLTLFGVLRTLTIALRELNFLGASRLVPLLFILVYIVEYYASGGSAILVKKARRKLLTALSVPLALVFVQASTAGQSVLRLNLLGYKWKNLVFASQFP